jgi:hypothetical protein
MPVGTNGTIREYATPVFCYATATHEPSRETWAALAYVQISRTKTPRRARAILHSSMSQAAFLPRSLLIFSGRLGSCCAVLRTAWTSISHSSAFVFAGSRLDGCHWTMDLMWGSWGRSTPNSVGNGPSPTPAG